jgi:hypothetical protein
MTTPAEARPAPATPSPACGPPQARVELHWLPLGAGDSTGCVGRNGRAFEALAVRRGHRPPCVLYHSALQVQLDGERCAIEMAPAWGNGGGDRGVVSTGSVGLRLLGRSWFFRYEVRRWRDETISDLARRGCRWRPGRPPGASQAGRVMLQLRGTYELRSRGRVIALR